MTEERFWELIEESRRGAELGEEGWEQREETLKNALVALGAEEILSFQFLFNRMRNRAYRWDLWAVAYIVEGGCSDDSFEYFRNWLVAQGREPFERVLADPGAIASLVPLEGPCEWETFGYVAGAAYQQATGKSGWEDFYAAVAEDTEEPWKSDPDGEAWTEEDLPALFPELWEEYGWDDDEEDDEDLEEDWQMDWNPDEEDSDEDEDGEDDFWRRGKKE